MDTLDSAIEDITGFFSKIGSFLGFGPKNELSEFQKKKLLHEFNTFYDINKDGKLEWKDLDMARESICKMNGWKSGTEKYKFVQDLFINLWRTLQDDADKDFDGTVTSEEWLKMWSKFNKKTLERQQKGKDDIDEHVPNWLDSYITYRFYLYDRAGDGVIDMDEFEYVLSIYDIPPKDCRAAFLIFTENKNREVDMDYFRTLALEYYYSDHPGALGNFINGKLTFD